MSHVILLGDSIFDNAAYVPGGEPVIEQLRGRLPEGWRATLLAQDGAIVEDVERQLDRLPPDASHLIISAGGNDALPNMQLIDDTQHTTADGFAELGRVQQEFRLSYRLMLDRTLAHGIPTTACTVYDSVPGLPRGAVAALAAFNDVIVREAVSNGIPVLDLRLICDDRRDYSVFSPIEPSEAGGSKIARGIIRIVTGHDFGLGETVVYGKRAI